MPELPSVPFKDPKRILGSDERTVFDLLVEAHPCCWSCGRRSVERFRRLAVRRYGSWFEEVLASRPEDLTDGERLYLSATWRQWVAGERPFSYRRRHVSS